MTQTLHWLVDDGVTYLLYATLVIVTLWMIKDLISQPLRLKAGQMQYKYRLRKKRASSELAAINYEHPFLQHLYFLINTTSKEKKENDILSFLITTILLMLASLVILLFMMHDMFSAVVVTIAIGFLPYLILQIRLRNIRFAVSKDFLETIQVLTQNYNSSNYNVYHSLVLTLESVENKTLRRVLIRLVNDLQVSRNEKDIRQSVDLFVFTTGSNWATRLGNILIKGYVYHQNILNALLELTRQIEETEEMLEQEKSQTMDIVMTGYMTIPLLIGSMVLGYYASGPQDWFSLQFENYWSRMVFIFAFVLTVFSVMISFILKKPKNDI